MTTALELNSPFPPPLPLHRFTVEQYHRLAETGVLTADDRVELLEGWIVEKMIQRPLHGFVVGLLTEFFQTKLLPGYIVRCQLPITTEHSEPEPDMAIVHGTHADYRQSHPSGQQCRLIIEVADTSLDKDHLKAAIYHAAGAQEYWIVDLNAKCLERYQFEPGSPIRQPELIQAHEHCSLRIGSEECSLQLKQVFA